MPKLGCGVYFDLVIDESLSSYEKMTILALVFVAAAAFQITSAAPLFGPLNYIWNIATAQEIDGPSSIRGMKTTAFGNVVNGDATENAVILNESAFNRVRGNAVRNGPLNAAVGNIVVGDAEENGLINFDILNFVSGTKKKNGLLNVEILGISKEYRSKGITIRLLSSGSPREVDGTIIDLLNLGRHDHGRKVELW